MFRKCRYARRVAGVAPLLNFWPSARSSMAVACAGRPYRRSPRGAALWREMVHFHLGVLHHRGPSAVGSLAHWEGAE